MSRPQARIEDAFDDDTDLPLPSRPLVHSDPRRAVIQYIDSDSENEVAIDRGQQSAGPASASFQPPSNFASQAHHSGPVVSDLTPYKKWTCIYPIYIDAKRPYRTGSRRVAREKCVWWPLSKDIAEAALRLNLGTLHEIQKCHPADWDNPGRVRVQWKRDGKLLNPGIRNKKELLETIAAYIQSIKPELIPKPPYNTISIRTEDRASVNASADTKGPTKTKSTQPQVKPKKAGSTKQLVQSSKGRGALSLPASKPKTKRLPHPPGPQPMLATCVSQYSPALPSGVLVETIKAGMKAAAEAPPIPGGTGGKGKRKVVRVRG